MRCHNILTRLRREQDGAVATEYALLLMLVAIVAIVSLTGIGSWLRSAFEYIVSAV